MMGLGLTIAIAVVSTLMGFGMADYVQKDCNISDDEHKVWLFGTAWVISSIIAGIAATMVLINS
jgi:phosphate/sulfate permease